MARTQFTFTFRNGEPGAVITFSADVYASKTAQNPEGPALVLDQERTVAVWSDATELTATWVDGAGVAVEAEASLAFPIVIETGGTAGASPAPSGGSSPITVLSKSITHATPNGTAWPELVAALPVGAVILFAIAETTEIWDNGAGFVDFAGDGFGTKGSIGFDQPALLIGDNSLVTAPGLISSATGASYAGTTVGAAFAPALLVVGDVSTLKITNNAGSITGASTLRVLILAP